MARDISIQLAYVLGTPPPGANPDTTLLTLNWRLLKALSLSTTVGNSGELHRRYGVAAPLLTLGASNSGRVKLWARQTLGRQSRTLKLCVRWPFCTAMSNTLPYGDSDTPESSTWGRASRTSLDRIAACGGPVVDLNSAGADDLCTVPGIGPTLAQRIISFRAEHGPFSDPSELAKVPRIGSRMAARLSERVSTYARVSGSDPSLPLALGTFGCPPPANVTIESGIAESARFRRRSRQSLQSARPRKTSSPASNGAIAGASESSACSRA